MSADNAEPDVLFDHIEREVSPEEKENIYDAVSCKKKALFASYPETLVENRFVLELKRLQIVLHDSTASPSVIMLARLDNV